ncbi:hypothetical protein GQ472_03735, partial [archaeon]|nr:hypothetical protein [archaeon]
VNLTVTSSILQDSPKIDEMITVVANITGNASELLQSFTYIYANITYDAINITSGNVENFTEEICTNYDFTKNGTLCGEDYTVFTCDYIPERSGLYNLTISATDAYIAFNGTDYITKYKTSINTSNFTVAFGNINITKTFAMMPSVNETFDIKKGFWHYGEDNTDSEWFFNTSGSIMQKKKTGYPGVNLLEALPPSKDFYIEVDIKDIELYVGLVFRDNGDTDYKFYYTTDHFTMTKGAQSLSLVYYTINISETHKLSVYAIGNELIGLVDGEIVIHVFDNDPIEYGKVGLFSQYSATFDNFTVYNILEPEDGLLLNQTFRMQSFADILDGDIWGPVNLSMSLNDSKIINTSDLTFIDGANVTVNKTMIVTWDLETETLGDINMTINITPEYGTADTEDLNATIMPLLAYPNNTVINYGNPQLLIINVTGFGPSLEGYNGMFSAGLQQQYRSYGEGIIYFNFDSYLSDISNNYYVYSMPFTFTDMSGIYDLSFAMENLYSKTLLNTTESFFVNYGTLNISIGVTTEKIKSGSYGEQTARITAQNGDVRNITLNFTSFNTTVINISTSDTLDRTKDYLQSEIFEDFSWNISAISEGLSNVTVNGSALFGDVLVAINHTINVTLADDAEAPKVENISLEYGLVNLKENLTIYADIKDNYDIHTAIAQVFYPNSSGYSENYTMVFTFSGNTYEFIFFNATKITNDTELYSIKIYANDSASFMNASDNQTTFNATDIYQINYSMNHILFNRGEQAQILMSILTVNNNTIDNYNLTMLMKKSGEENDTILLPNNMTTGYNYTLDGTDPTGTYNLSMNVSKYGNTANISGNFSVSNQFSLSFEQPTENYQTQQPLAWLYDYSSPKIKVFNARGEQLYWGLYVEITCAQPTSLPLIYDGSGIYYVDTDIEACQMPSFEGPFDILAYVNDSYNNTGSSSKTMALTYGSAPPGGGDDSTPSVSPNPGNPNPPSDPENYTSMEKRKEFFFSIDQRDISIIQGENAEIVASLDNTGDYDLNISITYISGCCDIGIDESYFVKAKNKQSIEIAISSKLSESPESYRLKIIASEGDIEKEETVSIRIEKNPLLTTLEYQETYLNRLEHLVNAFNVVGIDVVPYLENIELSKDLINKARLAVASNDLQSLESATAQLAETLDYLDRKTAEQEQLRWILENKYNLAGFIFSMVVFLFIFKSYMLSFILMSLELQQLKSKEFRLAAEEKSTEKEYFTRVIDKETFNKIITEKHKQLTDIRTRIVHIKKSLKKLIHGQRLKAEDLDRYKLKKDTKEKIKKKHIFKLPEIPSLKSIINSRIHIGSHAKEQVSNLDMPVDMAGKSPVSPQAQGPIQMPASVIQQPVQQKPTTSVPPQQSADPQKTHQKQQPEEKILGNEMREIYGETGPAEQPKESFADIKKKVNNIFDD